jgi:hypothetical protein
LPSFTSAGLRILETGKEEMGLTDLARIIHSPPRLAVDSRRSKEDRAIGAAAMWLLAVVLGNPSSGGSSANKNPRQEKSCRGFFVAIVALLAAYYR